MKKLISIFLVATVIIGLVILGCSKRNTSTTPAEDTATDTPTVVSGTATNTPTATGTSTITNTPTNTNTPGGPTPTFTNTQSVPAGMIDNCEDGDNANLWGGYWYTYNDANDGGTSWIWPESSTFAMSSPGYNSHYAVHVSGATGASPSYAFAGVGTQFNANGGCPNCQKTDISTYTGVRFWIKGTKSATMNAYVKLPYTGTCSGSVCQQLDNYDTYQYAIPAANFDNSWHQVSVPFSSFAREGWGTTPVTLTTVLQNASEIQFQFKNPNCSFDVWIDDLELY